MTDEFISEAIRPVRGRGVAAGTPAGEPVLPGVFLWRGEEYRLLGVLKKWKTSGPCTHGSGERYLRRHYYEVLAAPASAVEDAPEPGVPEGAMKMTLYCDRRPRGGAAARKRWFVYTIAPADDSSAGCSG